jgi:hypothetical protein
MLIRCPPRGALARASRKGECSFVHTPIPRRAAYYACLASTQDNDALKKLEILSDQLDTAREASEATTKEVQHARRTTETMKRDVRRKRPKPYTKDGKSKAAVELGRKGGAARAKQLTQQERSAVAKKAAKTRWKGIGRRATRLKHQ